MFSSVTLSSLPYQRNDIFMIGSILPKRIVILFIVAHRPAKRKGAPLFRQDLQTDGQEFPSARPPFIPHMDAGAVLYLRLSYLRQNATFYPCVERLSIELRMTEAAGAVLIMRRNP